MYAIHVHCNTEIRPVKSGEFLKLCLWILWNWYLFKNPLHSIVFFAFDRLLITYSIHYVIAHNNWLLYVMLCRWFLLCLWEWWQSIVMSSLCMCVCLCMSVSVCEHISRTAHVIFLYPDFCACCLSLWLARSSSRGWQNPKRKGQFYVFSPLTMHCTT